MLKAAMPHLRRLLLITALLSGASVQAGESDALLQLLDQRSCPRCQLQDADLVHANLRDADLQGARLQRANLSQAQLDGANLQGADLSFTTLEGASLRGADLRGARLMGTDLRQADLSGAQLSPNALGSAHWKQAIGVDASAKSYADLHNAGVEAAMQGRHGQAETFFGEAILKQPDSPVSWLARGMSRADQGKTDLAKADLNYAADLYEQADQKPAAEQIRKLSNGLKTGQKPGEKGGNGWGMNMLQGFAGLVQQVAPLAVKAFSYGMF
jgi:uncharacterized protein YjbI with pentapeptide repeats